jgi:hypothetical protein
MRLCRPLVDMGFRPLITTNLAKPYSGDEIALLARFGVIQVSLDSSDATMTRQIRKAVTPDRILANVARIRAASQGLPPRFTISAGLYDPSIWTLPQFADWIISNGFAGVTFWSLVKLDHVSQVMPLVSIDGERLAQVRRILSDVRARLAAARVGSDFAGDFNGSDGLPLLAA